MSSSFRVPRSALVRMSVVRNGSKFNVQCSKLDMGLCSGVYFHPCVAPAFPGWETTQKIGSIMFSRQGAKRIIK
jgi:hypothetical protein